MAKVKFDEIARECRSTFKGDKTGVAIVGLEHIVPNEMLVKNYEVDTENTFWTQTCVSAKSRGSHI